MNASSAGSAGTESEAGPVGSAGTESEAGPVGSAGCGATGGSAGSAGPPGGVGTDRSDTPLLWPFAGWLANPWPVGLRRKHQPTGAQWRGDQLPVMLGGVSFTAVVLASGTGTLAQALIDAQIDGRLEARVVAVGADRIAPVLDIARAAGLATFTVLPKDFEDRSTWNRAMTSAVAAFEPDLVVSAGFMRILGPEFLERFGDRTINTHPSLLPMFPGAHAVVDAMAAGAKVTGCTVHKIDAGVDTGPVLAQRMVPVEKADTVETLHERIKIQERSMLVEVVNRLASGRLVLPQ